MAAPLLDSSNNFEHEIDDWLFTSIKSYSHLHMYELQYPTQCLTWLSEKAVVVASSQPESKSELLELQLPPKLILQGDDEALCKDRDFKVKRGGFHSRHVTEIITDPAKKVIVTAQKDSNTVCAWDHTNNETDVIRKLRTINCILPSMCSSQLCFVSDVLVFGSHIHGLCTSDINSGQVSSLTTDEIGEKHLLCGLHGISNNQLIACTQNGLLWTIDVRSKEHIKAGFPPPENRSQWTSASHHNLVVLLSAQGDIVTLDSRNLNKAMSSHQVLSGRGDQPLSCQSPRDSNLSPALCTRLSPDASHLSVSGLDSNIHIYRLPIDPQRNRPLEPVFTHIGHWAEMDRSKADITSHIWHPSVPRLLLSADGYGGLHAWQYVVE